MSEIPVAGRLDLIDGDVLARVALSQTDVSIIGLCLDIKKLGICKGIIIKTGKMVNR